MTAVAPSAYFERAQAYAQRIVAGAEVAGRLERLACERFLRDITRAGTPEFPYVLDQALGARACRFVELMPHIKGEWARPVYLDGKLSYAKLVLEDWQIFCEFQLFGWVHMATGLRRFRRSYEEVARKNAKSTRIAARMLYLLTADGEPGAHCYSAATTGDQAREVFDTARVLCACISSTLQPWMFRPSSVLPSALSGFIELADMGNVMSCLPTSTPKRARNSGSRRAMLRAVSNTSRAWSPVVAAL